MNIKRQTLLNQYLLAKPTLRMMIEWPIMIIIGILGEIFSWIRIPLSPYSNFVGGAILLGGWIFHAYCHRVHKQAHEQSQQIKGLVTTGVFSKIRHPMYLSLIFMYLGLAIAWGVMWMLLPSLLFSALTVLTTIKEEEFLLLSFGHQYKEYMQAVPWRLIPKIF
jgi:protein-S-isoprenylcysteine O-methyltransferase Ste14